MNSFLETKSAKRLQAYSQKPFDLRQLTPERIEKMRLSGVGFDLLYGTERVDGEVIEALWQLAEERGALSKMAAMQAGEVLNRIEGFESENRSVLHTAMRDQFDERQSSEASKRASAAAGKELEKLEKFLK